MKKIELYDQIDANGNFKKPGPGNYLVEITSVKDDAITQKLIITFDIVEGEFAHYYTNSRTPERDFSTTNVRYTEKALYRFKGFITAVEKSNPGYHWDWDENKLIGKKLVASFGEEEYVKDLPEENKVEIRTICRVQEWHSVERLKSGDLKILDKIGLRPLDKDKYEQLKAKYEAPQAQAPVNDDDLPF